MSRIERGRAKVEPLALSVPRLDRSLENRISCYWFSSLLSRRTVQHSMAAQTTQPTMVAQPSPTRQTKPVATKTIMSGTADLSNRRRFILPSDNNARGWPVRPSSTRVVGAGKNGSLGVLRNAIHKCSIKIAQFVIKRQRPRAVLVTVHVRKDISVNARI
jgi:hypothetical protein